MDALLHCSTTVMQPAQLFPLFPELTRPWAQHVPGRPPWAALNHPPLTNLRSLVARRLRLASSHAGLAGLADNDEDEGLVNGNGSGDDLQRRLVLAAQQCIAEYLLEARPPILAHVFLSVTHCLTLQQDRPSPCLKLALQHVKG